MTSPLRPFLLALALLSGCLATFIPQGGNAADSADGPYAQISLIPEKNQIQAGETITVGIEQTLSQGWHTYWFNPGDSGTAPEIFWTLPQGFVTGEIGWPVPHKIPYGALTNYGYEERVVLLQPLTAPDTLPAGPVTLNAEITVLVCKDICIPETSTHTLTLNEEAVTDNTALIVEAAKNLPVTTTDHALFREETKDGKAFFVLEIAATEENQMASVNHTSLSMLPYEWGIINNSAAPLILWDGEKITIKQARAERDLKDIREFSILLTHKTTENLHTGLTVKAAADSSVTPVPTSVEISGSASTPASLSLWTALIFALMGGLALNLMPCVFPVLSLKAISLSRMGEKEQSHAVASGLAYTAGVVLSFALIAAILMALKATGAQIGWGFQLQNPVVVYALALLLFVIGLNLSGVFQLQGGFTNAGQNLTQKNGLSGAFFTGVLATLVATPCTAPFMGAAMGYALTQPAFLGMSVFVALGFGLALPYLLLTIIPPLRKMLPKPGAWMETFKEFLAFPMYASAAWLIWVMAQQAGSMAVMSALWGMIAIAFVFWAWQRRPRKKMPRLLITLIILLVGIAGLMAGFSEAGKSTKSTAAQQEEAETNAIFWQPFSQQRLDELLQGDSPIFVDMTAAWCITCKVNERVALNIPRTKALFKEKGIIALIGDWTNQDPEITKFLEAHGRRGVPLYVYYGPRDKNNGKRPASVVLPQILTPALVADTVQ